MLYTQYTINKMKSICTCNLIVKIHVHSLHSPTHTLYSHTHSHTHTHHTPPYSPNWWPVLCCSFPAYYAVYPGSYPQSTGAFVSHRLTAASPSLAEPLTCLGGGRGGILYHVYEKAIGYYSCIIDITFKVPSQIRYIIFCSGGTGKVDKFP